LKSLLVKEETFSLPAMYQPARFRHHYRKTLSKEQRRNRWLLYLGLLLLTVGGNRCTASCRKREPPEPPGQLVLRSERQPVEGSKA
jgi:hypothetical protein